MNCGGGLPVAEQRSETGGPGLRACSMKVLCSSGTVSAPTETLFTKVLGKGKGDLQDTKTAESESTPLEKLKLKN